MLVQRRRNGSLRLIDQHAHALICGDMAQAWRGLAEAPEWLGYETALGIGLHDYAWFTDDRFALLEPETGRPFDFLDYPLARRLTLYTDGIDVLERLDPYAAILVSLHYCAFGGMERQRVFQSDERARRERLLAYVPVALASPQRQQRDLALLQLFDLISLYLCLAPPSADGSWLPAWLAPDRFARYPSGERFRLSWDTDHRLTLDPSPWRSAFEVTLPYRTLASDRFPTQDALDDAFHDASVEYWTIEIA